MKFAIFAAIWIYSLRSVYGEIFCGPPPALENAAPVGKIQETYALGSNVQYKCKYGYLSQGIRIFSACQLDKSTDEPVWSYPEATCIPRSCGEPGNVNNAHIIGSRFTFPNYVEYVCNEGYKLVGSPKRYCQTTGQWSGVLPSCAAVECSIPSNPKNGRAIFSALEFGSELRYTCDSAFRVSNEDSRICGSDGLWTGVEPICSENVCDFPVRPEHGEMSVVGNQTTAGSIVVFTCNSGRILIGSNTAKCLSSREWTFPTPKCVEPCRVPSILNGHIFILIEKYNRYGKRSWVQQQIYAGTTLKENEGRTLKCSEGYTPAFAMDHAADSLKITCKEGKLVPEPKCVPKPCEIPHISNGAIIKREKVASLESGTWSEEEIPTGTVLSEDKDIFLKCAKGYEATHAKTDNVNILELTCHEGNLAPEPKCSPMRCEVPHIPHGEMSILKERRYSLLGKKKEKVPEKSIVNNGGEVILECDKNYAPVNVNNPKEITITCQEGRFLPEPSCIPRSCDGAAVPPVQNGVPVIPDNKPGTVIWYDCIDNSKKIKNGFVRCEGGLWIGPTPVCKDMRCYKKDLKFEGLVVENFKFISANQYLEAKCDTSFELSSNFDGKIKCEDGDWTANTQPCIKAGCWQSPPPTENGKITSYSTDHNSTVLYQCDDWFYMLEPPNVTCQLGKWVGPTPVCRDTRCYLKDLAKNEGVDMHNDDPIYPSDRVDIPCKSGYVLRYSNVKCFDGVLKTENNLSPCQPENEEYTGGRTDSSKAGIISEVFNEMKRNRTSEEDFGNNEASEMDEEGHFKQSKVTKFEQTNQTATDTLLEFTTSPLKIFLDHKESVNAPSEITAEASNFTQTGISGPLDVTIDSNNNTEVLSSVVPEMQDKKNSCQCVYNQLNEHIIAYNGNNILHFGNTVELGTVLKFRCTDVGRYRLFGPAEVPCKENCKWHSSEFPDCKIPRGEKDIIIKIFSRKEDFAIRPDGVITFVSGSQLILSCETVGGRSHIYLTVPWNILGTFHAGYYEPFPQKYVHAMNYTVDMLRPSDSGIYECKSTERNRHFVNIQVKDVYCPKLPETKGLLVTYEPSTKFKGRAIFHCSLPYERKGPQFVTCQASGTWSEDPASCQSPRCSVNSLFDTLPEDVAPMLKNVADDNVAYGDSVPLLCDPQNLIATGPATAVCSGKDKWDFGDTKCTVGCLPLPKKPYAREPFISPQKSLYVIGDSVILSCSKGKRISTDFERVACLLHGWSETWSEENAPECVPQET